MEKLFIWLIDLAFWMVMRMAFVTVPFREAFKKGITFQKQTDLKTPNNDVDLSVAITLAKEYLEDQERSSNIILDKFKTLIGMYSFSIPILIGFFSPKIVILPHWAVAGIGILICLPGFCMIRFFSIRTHVSILLSQDDISKPLKQQQIDQINWYFNKGATININNNHAVNIYFAAYRWLGLALVMLLFVAFILKTPLAIQPPSSLNIYFNNL